MGFPSPVSFTGFTHALSRKLTSNSLLTGVGIVCHSFSPKTHSTKSGIRFSISKNPVEYLYKDSITKGKTASIIEEGKVDFTVSLVIAIEGDIPDITETINNVQQMRIAGGSIQPFAGEQKARIMHLSRYKESDDDLFLSLRRELIPGFALVDRTELLKKHLEEMKSVKANTTLLDALLDRSAVKHVRVGSEELARVQRKGWIVPISVGYLGISELYENEKVSNTRDTTTPFRFVESAYTLGEWINPLKLRSLDEFLWFNNSNAEKGYYLVEQKNISIRRIL